MRWSWLMVVAGCSFTPGNLGLDAALIANDDAPIDVSIPVADSGPPTCYAGWLDGTVRFGEPVALTAINTASYERDPFLTADELTIYVSSGRQGDNTIWSATRASRTEAFGTPVKATAFGSSDGAESKLSMTSDELVAVVGSSRGSSQALDVWGAERATSTDTWPALLQVPGINTAGNDHDPTISADGLRLYLAPDSPAPQRLAIATRNSRTEDFSAPVTIAELFSDMNDSDPSPTPDERVLLFASGRTGSSGGGNLWYATRGGATATFAIASPVPDVNTNANEGDPHLSSDGCRIYFAREITTGSSWDIFVATAVP